MIYLVHNLIGASLDSQILEGLGSDPGLRNLLPVALHPVLLESRWNIPGCGHIQIRALVHPVLSWMLLGEIAVGAEVVVVAAVHVFLHSTKVMHATATVKPRPMVMDVHSHTSPERGAVGAASRGGARGRSGAAGVAAAVATMVVAVVVR